MNKNTRDGEECLLAWKIALPTVSGKNGDWQAGKQSKTFADNGTLRIGLHAKWQASEWREIYVYVSHLLGESPRKHITRNSTNEDDMALRTHQLNLVLASVFNDATRGNVQQARITHMLCIILSKFEGGVNLQSRRRNNMLVLKQGEILRNNQQEARHLLVKRMQNRTYFSNCTYGDACKFWHPRFCILFKQGRCTLYTDSLWKRDR